MPSDFDFREEKARTKPPVFWRPILLVGCVALHCASATASELVIGHDAVQALVLTSMFKDQGRWYLSKGKCYVYLERPRTSLGGGRLIIDAHLSSRLGLEVGDSCVGKDFASEVRLSGRFVGAGSQMTLDEIRIDNVQDDSTRQAVELLQSVASGALPKAVNVDLLQLLKPTIVPGTAIKVAVTKLSIGEVSTQRDAVTVEFELKLNAL